MCYNGIMLKTKTKVKICFVGIMSITAGIQASNLVSQQVIAETSNAVFQVNVVESLTVSLTTPSEWANANANTFMRNTVGLTVSTNNPGGFTASMYTNNSSATNTSDLLNTSDNTTTIPTLSSDSTRGSFPNDYWGYSLSDYSKADPNDTTVGDVNTTAGNDSGVYKSLTSTSSAPITVLYSAGPDGSDTSSKSQDIFFGAKASITKPSGTYQGSVVISAVSGPVDPNTNPITPDNPAGDATNPNPAYGTTYGTGGNQAWTTYTTQSSTEDTNTTTTTVSSGDNRASYPLGVTETVSNGAPLATGLAVTAAVAATSGAIFFILAKRKKDDEEEEEEEEQA